MQQVFFLSFCPDYPDFTNSKTCKTYLNSTVHPLDQIKLLFADLPIDVVSQRNRSISSKQFLNDFFAHFEKCFLKVSNLFCTGYKGSKCQLCPPPLLPLGVQGLS